MEPETEVNPPSDSISFFSVHDGSVVDRDRGRCLERSAGDEATTNTAVTSEWSLWRTSLNFRRLKFQEKTVWNRRRHARREKRPNDAPTVQNVALECPKSGRLALTAVPIPNRFRRFAGLQSSKDVWINDGWQGKLMTKASISWARKAQPAQGRSILREFSIFQGLTWGSWDPARILLMGL